MTRNLRLSFCFASCKDTSRGAGGKLCNGCMPQHASRCFLQAILRNERRRVRKRVMSVANAARENMCDLGVCSEYSELDSSVVKAVC